MMEVMIDEDSIVHMMPSGQKVRLYKRICKCGKIDFVDKRRRNIECKSCSRKRNKNPRWHGGTRKDSGGYVLSYCPDHPHSTKAGYVPAHRLIMESIICRYLKTTEIVHHINGDKKDNKKQNLTLFESAGDHQRHHNVGSKSHYAKLNDESVLNIRARLLEGITPIELAREHDVRPATIYNIINGRTWKCL